MKAKSVALTAVSIFTIVAAGPAFAQEADATAADQPATADAVDAAEDEAIVVTGYRQALRSALAGKRDADRVQEVLSSEDIGRLPEASIAESLARLPGLTTNRDRGNGTQISIRGLGPNLVNTLLNGREIVSAEASRNVRYEQYPAELISGAYVFKSPTASQVEGAIAGQIDLRTIRPLDYNETRIILNLRGIYSDLADDVTDTGAAGYIGSLSYVGQFADNTLGIALGYSGRRQAVATVRTNIFRYTNSFQDLDGDGTGNDDIPFGYEALARGGDDIRHGALAAVQWKPDDSFELNGDFFYSKVKFDETQRGFRVEGLPFGNGFSNATVENGSVTGIEAEKWFDFGLKARNVNELFFFEDDIYAGGLNARWTSGALTLTGDVGYSTTHRDQQFLTVRTNPHDVSGATPVERMWGFSSSFLTHPGAVPDFGFDFDISDPATNLVSDFQIPENGGGAPLINDDLLTLSTDLRYDFGGAFLESFVLGGRFTDRSKDYTQRTQFGFIDQSQRGPLSSDLLNDPVRFPGEFRNIPSTLSFDILDTVRSLFGDINPTSSDFDLRSSWVVKEKTYAGYGQLNFEGDLGSLPISGNLGLRVIRTETSSRSTLVELAAGDPGPTLTPIRVDNAFTDWLPNLNVTIKPSDQLQLRLGASKALRARPLDDLNAGYGVFTFGAPAAFGGNPYLEPFRANQLDATVEWYFDRDSALTIAGFYKDVDTYIVPQVTPIFVDDGNGNMIEGTFRQPVNGEGGTIKGFEILFQKAFTFLPAPFDGFGVYLNYSYTDSSITVDEDDNAIGTIALPGLSKHVGNATLYYSKSGFEARIGYRYRSAYATELGDTDRILYTRPEQVVDFQTSYDFQDGSPLAGLKLLFQANNLTDEPFETYYGDRNLQGRYEKFGRRFMVGVGFEF